MCAFNCCALLSRVCTVVQIRRCVSLLVCVCVCVCVLLLRLCSFAACLLILCALVLCRSGSVCVQLLCAFVACMHFCENEELCVFTCRVILSCACFFVQIRKSLVGYSCPVCVCDCARSWTSGIVFKYFGRPLTQMHKFTNTIEGNCTRSHIYTYPYSNSCMHHMSTCKHH